MTPMVTKNAVKLLLVAEEFRMGNIGPTTTKQIGIPRSNCWNIGGLLRPGSATFRITIPMKNAKKGEEITNQFNSVVGSI